MTAPRDQHPSDVPPQTPSAPLDAAPPPADPPPTEVDWPDRSHFSEFDLAIEASLLSDPGDHGPVGDSASPL